MAYENTPMKGPYDLKIIGLLKIPRVSMTDNVLTCRGSVRDIFFATTDPGIAGAPGIDDRTAFAVEVTDVDGVVIDKFTAQITKVLHYQIYPHHHVELSFQYNRVAPAENDDGVVPTKIDPGIRSMLVDDGFIGLVIGGSATEGYRVAISKYRVVSHGGIRYFSVNLYKVTQFHSTHVAYVVIGSTKKVPAAVDLQSFTARMKDHVRSLYWIYPDIPPIIQEVTEDEHC